MRPVMTTFSNLQDLLRVGPPPFRTISGPRVSRLLSSRNCTTPLLVCLSFVMARNTI